MGIAKGQISKISTQKNMCFKHWNLPIRHFRKKLFFQFGVEDPSQYGSWSSEGLALKIPLEKPSVFCLRTRIIQNSLKTTFLNILSTEHKNCRHFLKNCHFTW